MSKWTLTEAACKRIAAKLREEPELSLLSWRHLIAACDGEDVHRPHAVAEDWMRWAWREESKLAAFIGSSALSALLRLRQRVSGFAGSLFTMFEEADCQPWVDADGDEWKAARSASCNTDRNER